VQLPAHDRPEWPRFRDGQRRALDELANVGMAVAIDTGDRTNVHPALKRPVGERLARWALGTTYRSDSRAAYSGPLFENAVREGDSIVVSFQHVGNGLKSADGKPIRYFEVRGSDGVFHRASAKILGRNSIAVSCPRVAEPEHVRYAWLAFPDPGVNFINSEGLPASPFSTEDRATLSPRHEARDEVSSRRVARPY
jgi:sialate O-acetylesterase